MKQVVRGLGVGLVVSGGKEGAGKSDTHAAPGAQQWGLIYSSFSALKVSAPSSWGMFEGGNKYFDQGTTLLHGGED